jgi:UDPglucose 6-dehydrogenase
MSATEKGGIPRPALSVIGLGKLGAPMAAVLSAKGFTVVGLDLNADFVAAINRGVAPVTEPMLQETIDAGRSRLSATTDYAEMVQKSDVSFIIVPTPSGADKFFSNKFVLEAVTEIGHALRSKAGYHVVVVTSTVMPGATDGEIRLALEQASGRKVGPDLGLCYNPEFIALGSVVRDMLRPDLILIGESDSKAGDVLEAIYRISTESNPEFHRMNLVNAELCKISVNTFVTTKISYANMIADMCDHLPGADSDVVTSAVGADSRIGRKYLKGAIGYGGPCFPRDNKAFAALARSLGVNSELAEATDRVNDHQLHRLMGAVEAHAEADSVVAVLGMSYKPMTPVIEESQGVELARRLSDAGYTVVIADPMAGAPAKAVLGDRVNLAESPDAAVSRADIVVVTTPWSEFARISSTAWNQRSKSVVVIDPWSIVDAATLGDKAKLVRLGRGNWKPSAADRGAAAVRASGVRQAR